MLRQPYREPEPTVIGDEEFNGWQSEIFMPTPNRITLKRRLWLAFGTPAWLASLVAVDFFMRAHEYSGDFVNDHGDMKLFMVPVLVAGLPILVLSIAGRHVVWPTSDAQVWCYRLFVLFTTLAMVFLFISNFRDISVPWWVVVAPEVLCAWVYSWLKAGPEPVQENQAE